MIDVCRMLVRRASAGCATPSRYLVVLFAAIVAVLCTDAVVGQVGQAVLGAVVWLLLAAALSSLAGEERARVLVVVAIATCGELLASMVWGLYVYRLHNVPLYVPPGHGLVYLGGLRFAQVAWVQVRERVVRAAAGAVVAAWALAGLVGVTRLDVAGALAALVLLWVLARGRAPLVFAGVLVFVTALELIGTVMHDWTWQAHMPGLGLAQGNPPSGVACAYVLCDAAAIALGPRLLRAGRALRPVPSGAA